ncbi:MAG: fatty acid desaturase [Pseudomonadota bacterium]
MNTMDQLDRQANVSARKYMGRVAWPTVALGLVLAITYLGAIALTLAGALALWIAVPVVAVLTYHSYTILHDAVHGAIGGSNKSYRWLNRAMGYLAAWITMIPFTAHRHEHVAHHRYANDPARDPDYHMGGMTDSWLAPLRISLQSWFSQFTYYAKDVWRDASPRQNAILCIEVAAALLPRLAVILSGFWVQGLALFVLAWMIGAMILIYLFAYLVHRPHDQIGRYVDTATILPPASEPLRSAVNWFWLFQNYHTIHHLFPRVPFYQYAKLYDEIEHVLEAKGAPVYKVGARGLA